MAKYSQKLLDVAQRLQDQYLQDYAKSDEFFSLEDFAYWVGVVFAKMADDTAAAIYTASRSEVGIGLITFPQEWWRSKAYEIKKEDGKRWVDLDISYASFTYDTQNSGLQLLIPDEDACGSFIRTTITEVWQLNHVTSSDIIWWYVEDNKIRFKVSGDCNCKKIKLFYIPTTEDENFALPKSLEFQIATTAWQFLKQAEQGIIIDQTNDQNRNKSPQTESNLKQTQPVTHG